MASLVTQQLPRENVRLGYRSFFSVPQDEESTPIPAAAAQLHSWLRHKRYDVDALERDRLVTIAEGVTASVFWLSDRDGSETYRATVTEFRSPKETWESVLTVHVPGRATDSASVLLDISGPIQPRTPRLAGMLTGALPAYDSTAVLADLPRKVSETDLEAVVRAICDPDRRGLLFVAGMSAELPYDDWYRYVSKLLKQTTGLAASYFLDPAATISLEQALGPTHAVAPGTVRTFLPGADPASELDALRHRVLSTNRILRDSSHRLSRLLVDRAQDETLQAELPPKMRRIQRRIAEHVDELLLRPIEEPVDDLAPTRQSGWSPVSEPTVQQPLSEDEVTRGLEEQREGGRTFDRLVEHAQALLRRVLGTDEPSEDDWDLVAQLALQGKRAATTQEQVGRQLTSLRDQLEDGESVQRDLQARLQDEQLEHAAAAEELGAIRRRNGYLEGLLQRTELVGEVYSEEVIAPEEPADFEELLTLLEGLKFVSFSGDMDTTLALDQHDPLGVWAEKTWRILCALEDYGHASHEGLCSSDVEGYLRNLPEGCRGYSLNKHAPTESEDVQRNSRFRDARIFPVPGHVNSDGRIEMMAHFKIAQSGLISPRLHYYDDTARSGKVFVGYIGPHLPTKRTN